MQNTVSFKTALINFIRTNAQPPDKFSHQSRLYPLAVSLAGEQPFDDDVVFAGAWIHDLGVFVGHRPEDPAALASWDYLGYVLRVAPTILEACGFPAAKVPAVLEVIRTHTPDSIPRSFEATLVHDADILEQLGAIGILRTVSKVGRDTRFIRFSDAIRVLQKNATELERLIKLDSARTLAIPRLKTLRCFFEACEMEAGGVEW